MQNTIISIYNLPDEIQNNIFRFYWKYKFNDVMTEINNLITKDKTIFNFLIKNISVLSREYANNYIFYFNEINDFLKNICNNKGLILISKLNELHFKDIQNVHNYSSVFYNKYKYISYYLYNVIKIKNNYIFNYFNSKL
tara:strand:+ start:74 stop:490 length:417 start_codon:yes stop_codon:yes gene_type:complete